MKKTLKSALFIMCDQLRRDYVSAYGHSPVPTPNIDSLAQRGTRFDGAYVQGPVCGPSRMSYYTGRYVLSHGARWNRTPLPVGEHTLGDYLRRAGRSATLAGKSHVLPDTAGLNRFGIEIESQRGALLREGGFEPIERFDGHSNPDRRSGYADFLRSHGYHSDKPWEDFAISVQDKSGAVLSGWQMRNLHLPARVAEEHSETAYLTDLAIDFMQAQANQPWCLHLSYVKPHWPYVAPAPYHEMFRDAALRPTVKSAHELEQAHPVIRAFHQHEESQNFGRDDMCNHVKPAYMGLVAQVDHHIGRIIDTLTRTGQLDDTLIVFCADHGDMLGDHWLGEKEIFYEAAVRIPLIVVDPRPEADVTRGTGVADLVEAIDVLPTILDALDVTGDSHRVEGRSLLPLMQGNAETREAVFSEADYSHRGARLTLGRGVNECRGWMVRTQRWKYVIWEGFRPQLFDLQEDPDELHDLGASSPMPPIANELRDLLLDWSLKRKNRSTQTDLEVESSTQTVKKHGIYIGVW